MRSSRRESRAALEHAFREASFAALIRAPLLSLLEQLFLGDMRSASDEWRARRDAFVLRFQQVSGPATAKGIEDTALYRYSPLLSLNEVGADPGGELRDAVGYLHDTNIERSTRWPRTMLATNTHDTKRSADVRARIDALSEVPREWAEQLARWERAHRGLKVRVHDRLAPDAHMEYVIYQTLVGVWPVYRSDAGERDALCARVSEFARKAARAAKGRTSWTDPDEEYEGALACFIRSLFDRAEFVRELEAFVESIAASGALNAIARTVLHLTSPGFPDIYQGDELWNYSLVDPDNRREVSYEVRERLLGELEAMSPIGDMRQAMNSLDFTVKVEDALKLVIIQRILLARAANAELFAYGDYRPLGAHGSHADHLFAFARRTLGAAAIVVVPRLTHAFAPHTLPVGELWADTTLHLPGSLASTRWRCAISGRELTVAAHASTDPALAPPSTIPVPVSQILAAAPVAVLLTTPASVKKPK